MNPRPLQGVFAAAVTPLLDDFSPDADRIPELLSFLAVRGCHGALILGTTGEGPSFSPLERRAIFAAAARVREVQPEFVLLGGTGTPSLQETVELNRTAFELGFDGVVVLPPYYYRNAPEEGLLAWFTEVIRQSIPTGGRLLGYHIPAVSGVPITINLLRSLSDRFPRQFAGLKDSSGDADHALALGQEFSPSLAVFNGNDSLFNLALTAGAAGCITAPANLISPMLRRMWDSAGDAPRRDEIEGEIEVARRILDGYLPAPAALKGILAERYGFPRWTVRPPLLPLDPRVVDEALEALDSVGILE